MCWNADVHPTVLLVNCLHVLLLAWSCYDVLRTQLALHGCRLAQVYVNSVTVCYSINAGVGCMHAHHNHHQVYWVAWPYIMYGTHIMYDTWLLYRSSSTAAK